MFVMIRYADELPDVMQERSDFQQRAALSVQFMNGTGLIENLKRQTSHSLTMRLVKGVFAAELKGRADDLVVVQVLLGIKLLRDHFED